MQDKYNVDETVPAQPSAERKGGNAMALQVSKVSFSFRSYFPLGKIAPSRAHIITVTTCLDQLNQLGVVNTVSNVVRQTKQQQTNK